MSAGSGAGAGVVAGTTRAGPADDVREWWQRLGDAWRRWSLRHGTALRRLRRARSVWLWLSLAWLLVLVVARPELRESLRVFARVYWLLVVWFLLTRTRTVPWRLVAGLYEQIRGKHALGGLVEQHHRVPVMDVWRLQPTQLVMAEIDDLTLAVALDAP